MIRSDLFETLDEAWHKHIADIMDGAVMQSKEYRDRQLDYLSGAHDVLSVYGTMLMRATCDGRKPLTVPILADAFYKLFADTDEQHKNLITFLQKGIEDAQSDNAVDDKPKPV
jgi:hypothetical protein